MVSFLAFPNQILFFTFYFLQLKIDRVNSDKVSIINSYRVSDPSNIVKLELVANFLLKTKRTFIFV